MHENIKNTRVITLMVALALFNFIFLGTEYLFDNMMSLVTSPVNVVAAQGYILGASVIGFVLYPWLSIKIPESVHAIAVFTGALAEIICIFVIWQHTFYALILVAGCLAYVLLGIAGSAVHYHLSCVAKRDSLAKTASISYALGILFQYLNTHLMQNSIAESIILAVSSAVVVLLLLKAEQEQIKEDRESLKRIENSNRAGVALITVVMLMTCIFSTLDAEITLIHVSGNGDVGNWPRLLLVVSALLAGVFYDACHQKYMNLIMYGVTILSTLCIVVMVNGGSFYTGLVVFYLSAGFFVVYFTSSFMELSYNTNLPQLWAGLGRAVNNVCAFIMSSLSLKLLQSNNSVFRNGIVLLLFVLISVAFHFYATFLKISKEEDIVEEVSISEEERLQQFSRAFLLTPRETEVLHVLLVSDDNVQEIAEQLLISRAALYRHITSINEKTNTKSRIGLVQFYYQFKGGKAYEKDS
ncbi:MAG: helix-turn-helix transcriptional regulator [Erysipelotrichaceae bacterium]|nr:helix-turn-helix transcriptional regulator [Solobacterium sp.]MDY4791473.1 helix-turn-helix transcriptional regulator [Erysipelotrichaceae bacterium]